jgi:linearmycin/streptolysin S transport system permease protein
MTTLRTTLAVTWKELQVTFRDRGLLAILFLLPLVFASLFSLSQQGAADLATGATALTVEVFLVNEDAGPYGAQVAETLKQMTILRVEELGSAAEADERIGAGERTAAIVIPAGFSAGIDAYQPTEVEVVVDPVQQALAGVVVGLANFAVTPASTQGELLEGTRRFIEQSGVLEGAPPEVQAAVEAQTAGAIMAQLQQMQANPPITVVTEGPTATGRSFNLMDAFMPAFAVMFAFFLTGHIGQTFHTERDQGTFRRLLASPLSRTSLVAGPTVAYMLVVVAQVAFLFGIGAGLFKLELGDSLLGLVAVSLALGLTVATLGLLLGVIARTGRQADTLGTLVAFVLPFISGIFPMGGFEPTYMAGGVIGTIAMFIPHMHAAEGYRLVMTGEGTPETVLTQVVILLGFAAIFFVLASRRLRFR